MLRVGLFALAVLSTSTIADAQAANPSGLKRRPVSADAVLFPATTVVTMTDTARAAGHASWRWPVVGGAIGAVLGGVAASSLVTVGCDTSNRDCSPALERAKFGAMGALLVGATGAAVGATARWLHNRNSTPHE
jgi:hypothetical protein